MRLSSAAIVSILLCTHLVAQTPKKGPAPSVPASTRAVLNGITAANLRGNLSFLASDALQGRYTPSPGLDVAAEFIASQFRAAGLQPGGDHDYFQLAEMVDRRMPKVQSSLLARESGSEFPVPPEAISVAKCDGAVHLQSVPVVVASKRDPEVLSKLDVRGKAVLAPNPLFSEIAAAERDDFFAKMQAFDQAIQASGAKAELLVGRSRRPGQALLAVDQLDSQRVPVVYAESEQLKKWLTDVASGTSRTISFDIPAPEDRKVELKNVIGVVQGTDPKLKDTCVLLTAHYDHIGTLETGRSMTGQKIPDGSSDTIFNGANDDGSGTVSVIEIARALARTKPRRSLVFMTFFGEERGDIGSTYYGRHPAFPIAKTVADINLEQVGRTDSSTGPQVNTMSLTGYDYSEVPGYLEQAGRLTGVKVVFDKQASDDYFLRSDNAALASQGVPAHSLTVAFDYPDYHGLGDEWPKVDYENMARVDRTVALALLKIADNVVAPKWNASNPKTAAYREAQSKLNQLGVRP